MVTDFMCCWSGSWSAVSVSSCHQPTVSMSVCAEGLCTCSTLAAGLGGHYVSVAYVAAIKAGICVQKVLVPWTGWTCVGSTSDCLALSSPLAKILVWCLCHPSSASGKQPCFWILCKWFQGFIALF
jgi:hypothetical protein